MDYLEFLEKIGLEKMAIEKIVEYKIDDSEMKKCVRLLARNKYFLFEHVNKRGDSKFFYLVLYCKMAFSQQNEWLEKGFDKDDYIRQFRDIALWNASYFRKHSSFGLDEYDWISNSVSGKILRLGRLQYEMCYVRKYPKLLDFSFKKKLVLNMHIPEDGTLEPSEVKKSIEIAKKYFNCDRIVCRSWLLSSILKKMLPSGSNILEFQSLFDISTFHKSKQMIDRVFDYPTCPYEELSERTSLQRAVKKYILQGGKTNEGSGILKNNI